MKRNERVKQLGCLSNSLPENTIYIFHKLIISAKILCWKKKLRDKRENYYMFKFGEEVGKLIKSIPTFLRNNLQQRNEISS